MLPMHWLHSPSSKVSATVCEPAGPWEMTCGGPGTAGRIGGRAGAGPRVVLVGALVSGVVSPVAASSDRPAGEVVPAAPVDGLLPAHPTATSTSRTSTAPTTDLEPELAARARRTTPGSGSAGRRRPGCSIDHRAAG